MKTAFLLSILASLAMGRPLRSERLPFLVDRVPVFVVTTTVVADAPAPAAEPTRADCPDGKCPLLPSFQESKPAAKRSVLVASSRRVLVAHRAPARVLSRLRLFRCR
jgi:hypothetical protein